MDELYHDLPEEDIDDKKSDYEYAKELLKDIYETPSLYEKINKKNNILDGIYIFYDATSMIHNVHQVLSLEV
mgnify:CR=1 FL=1